MRTRRLNTVLVANRGEIAVRILATVRRLGLRGVAVYSDDELSPGGGLPLHATVADEAVHLPGGYLDVAGLVAAAQASGADAVHPGYGFLAENARFATACAEAGLTFVGPPVVAIAAMGDKIRAKATAVDAGVPVVPGSAGADLSDDALVAAALETGLPVLLKPSAGGGGKGMHLVRDEADLPAAIAVARREAVSAFGDGALLVERFVDRPRHIEVQVFADTHGTVVHLGERECSLQRRHQKVIEEAPSILLSARQRAALGAAAVRVTQACGYVGAGTVEFLVPGGHPDEFFFLEMNTRLQVEHPVTELVTGLDLVAEQLRVAAGEPLSPEVTGASAGGHAVEARVYAEDPDRGFLPTGGTVLALTTPTGPGVRVDTGIAAGTRVGATFDPLLAKVVAWGADRDEALDRLDRALAATTVLGVTTNVAFLRALLRDPAVRAGDLTTGLVEEILDRADPPATAPVDAAVAAVLGGLADREPPPSAPDPFGVPSGWRPGAPAWTAEILTHRAGAPPLPVRVRGRAAAAEVSVDGGPAFRAVARFTGGPAATVDGPARGLWVEADGVASHWWYLAAGEVRWVGRDGAAWGFRPVPPVLRQDAAAAAGGGPLRSPMPGTVTVVSVAAGDVVAAGQPVVSVEAMKMEHVVRAAVAGTVTEVRVAAGQPVAMDAVLAVVEAVVEPEPALAPAGEA